MKTLLKKVVKPFLPKYEVVCTTYQIIPGLPVNRNQSKHSFEKGAAKEAKAFYGKVIASDFTKNMAPVEIRLRIGGMTVKKAQIGPVQDLKKFRVVTQN